MLWIPIWCGLKSQHTIFVRIYLLLTKNLFIITCNIFVVYCPMSAVNYLRSRFRIPNVTQDWIRTCLPPVTLYDLVPLGNDECTICTSTYHFMKNGVKIILLRTWNTYIPIYYKRSFFYKVHIKNIDVSLK